MRTAPAPARLCIALLFAVWISLGAAAAKAGSNALGPGMMVTGSVVNIYNRPLGGLRVQLFNPQIGPSTPVMTTPRGVYYFKYVPMHVNAPYEIRVMWGNRIVYRQYLRHLGQQSPIILR